MAEIFPIKNRRDSLQIDYHHIRRQVGAYLGHGYSFADWDDAIRETIDDIIRDGVQQYYHPPILPEPYAQGMTTPHEWSWMRPRTELTTSGGVRRYNLPEDFERFVGRVSYTETSSSYYVPLLQTTPNRLQNLEFLDRYQTYPQFFAVEPAESQGDAPQRLVLALHPTPDGEYVIQFQYQSLGRQLTPEHPYPLGGQMHGPGILASCLAIAEERQEGAEGPKWKRFMEILAANVGRDFQRGAQYLGQMSNGLGVPNDRGALREADLIYSENMTYGNTNYFG